MKRTILCIFLIIVSIFSFVLWGCSPDKDKGDKGPVANAELDEYNQIVNQMKDVFAQTSNQPELMSATSKTPSWTLFSSSKEDAISTMFAMMQTDSTKKESSDSDYYAYGIDFSTMTARIAGYAANNFFKVSSFYGLNILMDYGGSTIINACVQKQDSTIKTYIYTTFKDSKNNLFKEYNYAEINFTSQTDFNILVIDYVYNEQNVNTSKTMIYASSQKDFFLMSGDVDNVLTSILFFNKGSDNSAYVIEGRNSNTISNLFALMDENFALSSQDISLMAGLYNTENYSISYKQVIEAKTDLGILINMEDEEYVAPMGFVSNKNAEDLVGRKTLQAFVDDGQSVEGTTLTIPKEFNYLSGGIYFDADIDTLVIPSTIKGIVVYDRIGNYSILNDSLCYYDAGDSVEDSRYRPWGGTLISYVSDSDNGFWTINTKPFKKYILLDDNGTQTNETDFFVLDEMGNLWIKDSNGNKNYLWGFVSEPLTDTLYLPSPTYTSIDGEYIQVDHFACEHFIEGLKNIGKQDEYTASIKNVIIDGYTVEQEIPNMGIQPGFYLLRNTFFVSFEYDEEYGGLQGLKWNLDTLTINNIVDGAIVSLYQVFCSESYKLDEYGYPTGGTVCQAKVKKVILNGDFDTITFINGYCEMDRPTFIPGQNGMGSTVSPDMQHKITGTFAISEEYELNGRENATLSFESEIYGQKVVEIYQDELNFPMYMDIETLLIKSSVSELRINNSLFKIGQYYLPEDRKLTVEFENLAGIDFSSFYIYDLMSEGSTRVEKIMFNLSEEEVQNLIQQLDWNPNASWLSDIVNSNRFIIEYAQ